MCVRARGISCVRAVSGAFGSGAKFEFWRNNQNKGYHCADPTSRLYELCPSIDSSLFQDGFCDQYTLDLDLFLNSAMCMWDGGDCCPSTCHMPDGSACTLVVYDCLDPNASDRNVESNCQVASPSWLGDAYCDANGNGCVRACVRAYVRACWRA